MKITGIEIYGFGKWVDTTFELDSDLQIYYGENESGKTTLMTFIHHILFGFPTRHRIEERYEPKRSTQYGGKLHIEDARFGKGTIERVAGKVAGDVTVSFEEGQSGNEAFLDTLLYSVDRQWYTSLFSFDLDGLQAIDRLTPEKLNRFYLSAGVLGTETFLEQADKLNKKADDLYKPMGRVLPINKQIKTLEKLSQKISEARKKNSAYLALVSQKESYLQDIARYKLAIQEHSKSIQELQQSLHSFDDFEKYQQLEKDLKNQREIVLPDDGLQTLDNLQYSEANILEQLAELQERLVNLENIHHPSEVLKMAQQFPESMAKIKTRLPQAEVDLEQYRTAMAKHEDLLATINQLKVTLNISNHASLPRPFTERDKETVRHLREEEQLLASNLSEVTQQHTFEEQKQETLYQEIDRLEADMWKSDTLQQAEKEWKKQKTPHVTKAPAISPLVGMLMIVAVVSGMIGFLSDPIQWPFLLVAIGTAVSAVLVRTRRQQRGAEPSPLGTYEQFIQQKEMRRQWQEKLAQADRNEEAKLKLMRQYQELTQKQGKLEDAWSELKQAYALPKSWSVDDYAQNEWTLNHLQKAESEVAKQEEAVKKLQEKLVQWRKLLAPLSEVMSFKGSEEHILERLTAVLDQLAREEKQQKDYVTQVQHFKQQEQSLRQEQQRIHQGKTELFQSVAADNERAFRNLYEEAEAYKQKQGEYAQLQKNLEHHIQTFENYSEKAELEEAIVKQEKQKETLEEEQDRLEKEMIDTEVSKRDLEKGGAYTTLLQTYENEKSMLQELTDEWVSYKIEAALIEETLKGVQVDNLPKTLTRATDIFKRLTLGAYIDISFQEEVLYIKNKKGQSYLASELSTGTGEQLYVALRFAFVLQMVEQIPLPVLIDDGFVNFDHERQKIMYDLLKELSEHTQVIFFTFNDNVWDYFDYSIVTPLKLN